MSRDHAESNAAPGPSGSQSFLSPPLAPTLSSPLRPTTTTTTPSKRIKHDVSRKARETSDDWISEADQHDEGSERGSQAGRSTTSSRPSSPMVKKARSRTAVRTPTKITRNASRPVKSKSRDEIPERSYTSSRSARVPTAAPAPPAGRSTFSTLAGLVWSSILKSIQLVHVIFGPFYPYIFLTTLGLVTISAAAYYLLNIVPPLLFSLPGKLFGSILPSLPSLPIFSADSDVAIGQNLAILPLRSLATPACLLAGQLCQLSLLAGEKAARPFWKLRPASTGVNVGEVARTLTKEVKGAKDIFESIALLSEGGIMDRLGYVTVWELGAAIQIGSELEEKDIVSKQLYELGNDAKDLSDELVETNAMAVNAFTWLQWEFASLVKLLSLPPQSRPSPEALAKRLNALLKRLSDTLAELHEHASRAHKLAAHGSQQGRHLRSHLDIVGAELQREQEKEPGWKAAVDKGRHFILGGEVSKAQRISRDLRLTKDTIHSLWDLVKGLEGARSAIKGFRDQIGFFDASMMGFHLGAGQHVGIGPEEEVQMLADVVEEFGSAIGRARVGGRGREEGEPLALGGREL